MNQELLRIVDSIARDKNIERESIFGDLEAAMESGARKHFGTAEEIEVRIDRETGEILAFMDGEQINIRELGRIPAQTAKQVMIQKLREDERGSIFAEYQDRVGEVVAGTAARFESGATIVSLGRAEAILPRGEQIPGETHHQGERVRAMIFEVKEAPNQVKIILSRTHPDFILRLFEQEVPEVAEHVIEIRALSREAGYRTKVAVASLDSKVDAVGACVGVRGSRIKNIVDELGGEKIDIVRWNESSQIFIANALRPAEIREIALCFELNRATVVVGEDQLSLAIGKRGQNVRLAARLTNWDIDILTPQEYSQNLETLIKTLREVESVDDTLIDKIVALGVVSVLDLEEIGPEPLVQSLDVAQELAEQIIQKAAEVARDLAKSKEANTVAQSVLAEEMAEKPAPAEPSETTSESPLNSLLAANPVQIQPQVQENQTTPSEPIGEENSDRSEDQAEPAKPDAQDTSDDKS